MKEGDNFGLIGKGIDYSFSKDYFTKKFNKEKINCEYHNFDIEDIGLIDSILSRYNIIGLNVTIPYNESVLDFLDDIDETAKIIGAVNTIKIIENKKVGYNTDHLGFKKSILNFIDCSIINKALILGNGGATKAIKYALDNLNIEHQTVSRKKGKSDFTYDQLNKKIIHEHTVIINCTPIGTFPNIKESPKIPYEFLCKKNYLYDLVYNPEKSEFLRMGLMMGCRVKNGFEMLKFQAEESWKIWNN
jgi:shikimate dehydrogenase